MDIFLGIFKSLRIPQGLNRKEIRRETIMLKSQSPKNSIGMVCAESMAITFEDGKRITNKQTGDQRVKSMCTCHHLILSFDKAVTITVPVLNPDLYSAFPFENRQASLLGHLQNSEERLILLQIWRYDRFRGVSLLNHKTELCRG